jgi:hypothetical protein
VSLTLDGPATGFVTASYATTDGSAGSRAAAFTVTLSPPADGPVTVAYATQDGTSLAGQDYAELPETFTLRLSGPSGAAIAASTGTATVLDRGYYAVTPCRVVDTRKSAGPAGGGALVSAATRTFPVAGRCGIPAWANAVSLNVTVTQPSTAGHLRLFPGGTDLPQVSTLNFAAGATRANKPLVMLGVGGELSVFCMLGSGSAHVIVDVNGYFATE